MALFCVLVLHLLYRFLEIAFALFSPSIKGFVSGLWFSGSSIMKETPTLTSSILHLDYTDTLQPRSTREEQHEHQGVAACWRNHKQQIGKKVSLVCCCSVKRDPSPTPSWRWWSEKLTTCFLHSRNRTWWTALWRPLVEMRLKQDAGGLHGEETTHLCC